MHLPGLQTGGGNVKVTPVGSGPNTCKVKTWNRNVANTAELVHVRCFTAYTGAVNTPFAMTFTQRASILGVGRATGYTWANHPRAASYAPPSNLSFDSAGGTVRVTRSSTGHYTVNMPNLGTNNGDVQVTAFGRDANVCQVASWAGGGPGTRQFITVLCYKRQIPAWVASDERFTIEYVR